VMTSWVLWQEYLGRSAYNTPYLAWSVRNLFKKEAPPSVRQALNY